MCYKESSSRSLLDFGTVRKMCRFTPVRSYGKYGNETLLPKDLGSTNKMLHKQLILFVSSIIEFTTIHSKRKMKPF